MASRNVRFDPNCDEAARALGGYEAIDDSLLSYLDALHREPAGFARVDTDWGSVRYIRTKAIADTPKLLWYFILEPNGDVLITYVERDI